MLIRQIFELFFCFFVPLFHTEFQNHNMIFLSLSRWRGWVSWIIFFRLCEAYLFTYFQIFHFMFHYELILQRRKKFWLNFLSELICVVFEMFKAFYSNYIDFTYNCHHNFNKDSRKWYITKLQLLQMLRSTHI